MPSHKMSYCINPVSLYPMDRDRIDPIKPQTIKPPPIKSQAIKSQAIKSQTGKSTQQGHRYILLNKPYDVLSQFTDASGRKTLSAFVPIPQVYPVGRLDRDSEGLLLLTSDGGLQHRLSHPKFHHPKTYWVQVERVPDGLALERLRCGVEIQGYRTRPATVRPIAPPEVPPRDPPIRYRKSVPTAWLELTITEGRNRQVRRMTAAVGFPTLRLIRVAIASLHLGSLAPGDWRDLTPLEVEQLRRLGQRRLGKQHSDQHPLEEQDSVGYSPRQRHRGKHKSGDRRWRDPSRRQG